MDKKVKQKEASNKNKDSANKAASSRLASQFFVEFELSFNKKTEIEDKISCALGFMREILSQSEKMNLRDFWDAKKLCMPLFKKPIPTIKRNHLWSEYIELIDEAGRLKNFFNEQAAFAIEQIELAIHTLESDIKDYDQLLKKIGAFSFPHILHKEGIEGKCYEKWCSELKLLKTLIARLDGLRKEILSQNMRVGKKNHFLKRLSKLGDHVFPRRKELIKEVSDRFISEVEAFTKTEFSKGDSEEQKQGKSLYTLREMIKGFQALAKKLMLNAQAFSKSRQLLSECWEWIKEKDKERKQELGKQSQEHKENFAALKEKINQFHKRCSDREDLSREKIAGEGAALADEVKKASLSREGKRTLSAELSKIEREAFGKIKEASAAAAKVEEEKIEKLKQGLSEAIEKEAELSLEALISEEEKLLEALEPLLLPPVKCHMVERQFSDLRGFILDKKVIETSSKEELEELALSREQLQAEIRDQIETYRIEMGRSGLDFEQAMTYRELYDSAKIHLDRELEALEELREKLTDLDLH